MDNMQKKIQQLISEEMPNKNRCEQEEITKITYSIIKKIMAEAITKNELDAEEKGAISMTFYRVRKKKPIPSFTAFLL